MANANKRMVIEIIYDDDKGTPTLKANQAAMKKYGKEVDSMNKQLSTVTNKQTNVARSTNRANLAMMDAGRIVQDLPYGLRGVANNIDPMIQSFQRLKNETGSSTNALKTMLGAMTGPAGIAIAVSAVTSLLVAFGPQIKEYFSSFGEGAEDVKKANEKLERFKDIIKTEVGGVFDELAPEERVNALNDALAQFDPNLNGAKELKVDAEAIRAAMSRQSPDDLFFRTENNKLIAESREEINAMIAEQFKINDLVEEELKNRLAVAEAEKLISEALERLKIQREDALPDGYKTFSEELKPLEARLKSLKDIMGPSLAVQQEIAQLEEQISKLKEMQDLQESIRTGSFKPEIQIPDDTPIDDPLNLEGMTEDLDLLGWTGEKAYKRLANSLASYGYMLDEINEMGVQQAQILLEQHRNAEILNQTLTAGLNNAMASSADIMGQLISQQGSGEELFGQFQNALSNFMSSFGRQLIALGTAKIGLDNLFKAGPLGGPAAIAAGIALIAAAGAVRSNAQSQLNSITGSGSGQSRGVTIGYRGAEVPSGQAAQSNQFPSRVAVDFTDGTGNIVASGMMELDRKGRKLYNGSGGN